MGRSLGAAAVAGLVLVVVVEDDDDAAAGLPAEVALVWLTTGLVADLVVVAVLVVDS